MEPRSPATGGSFGDGGPAIDQPSGMAVDSAGNLYIAGGGSGSIRKVSAAGIITTVVGGKPSVFSGDGGPAVGAGVSIHGLAVDGTGNLYIADNRGRIQ